MLNIKKVIFASVNAVHRDQVYDSGLAYLIQHGYMVEIWIVARERRDNPYETYDKECDLGKVVWYDTWIGYERAVRLNADNSLFYCPVGHDFLFCALEKYQANYIVLGELAAIPSDSRYVYPHYYDVTVKSEGVVKGWYRRNKDRLLLYPFIKAKRLFAGRINKRYKRRHQIDGIYPPRAVIVSTQYAYDCMLEKGVHRIDECPILFANGRNYNVWLKQIRRDYEISEKCIVFAESALGLDKSGYYMLENTDGINIADFRNEYIKQISELLDIMEDHYALPAIIAAHPRHDMGGLTFGGREVVYGKTCELAQKCKVFMTPTSGAIAYPLLFNKPILYYFNDTIMSLRYWNLAYKPMMNALKIKGFNMDDDNAMKAPWDYVELVDPVTREDYLRKYEYSLQNPNKLIGETLDEYIRSIRI